MEKGKLWMLIIIVILALMCVGFVIGFIMLTNTINALQSDPEGSKKTEAVAGPITQADIEDIQIGDASKGISSNLKVGEDGKKDHFVVVWLQIGINKKDADYADLSEVIKAKTFVMEDIVTGIVRMKTYEELNMDGADSLLKEEILTKLQDYFQTSIIIQVNLRYVTT